MATRADGSLIHSGYLDRPLRTLDSVIATTLPAGKLEAFMRGEIDRHGNPTARGVLAPVEQEARSHWIKLHEYRRSLAKLRVDPDLPLREEWITRTEDNADWHRRRLVELLSHRRRIKVGLIAHARLTARQPHLQAAE